VRDVSNVMYLVSKGTVKEIYILQLSERPQAPLTHIIREIDYLRNLADKWMGNQEMILRIVNMRAYLIKLNWSGWKTP